MTSRTWIGGGNNSAHNPNDWSPNGVPQPGDALNLQTGVMNARGDDLAGNTLIIHPSQTPVATMLNLSHHANVSVDIGREAVAQVTINVEGTATLRTNNEFPSGATFIVNLADHASLTSSFNMVFSSAVVGGGEDSRVVNSGANSILGSNLTIDPRVKGHGSFTVGSAQSIGGQLEFGGSVSRGQDVSVSGDPERLVVSHVQVDDPDNFHGAVTLNPFGEVDLRGLTNADSYQFENDMLSIYSGSDVIEKLRLATPPPASGTFNLSVSQTATGVAVDRGSSNASGTVLPLHSLAVT